MAHSSNKDRAHWRTQCRNELSKHICKTYNAFVNYLLIYILLDNKLGIDISPTNSRLITGPEDPYKWSRLPAYKHLFQKRLSKHSIEAYITIYHGIGKYFEAVLADLEVELSNSLIGCQEMYLLLIFRGDEEELQQVRH
jgi:hypothetical protein